MNNKEQENKRTEAKEEENMDAILVRKIDKTNLSGLTLDKKQILKSMQGIATSPIDFNKIRNIEKYGESEFQR